jgi:hypothetical protein
MSSYRPTTTRSGFPDPYVCHYACPGNSPFPGGAVPSFFSTNTRSTSNFKQHQHNIVGNQLQYHTPTPTPPWQCPQYAPQPCHASHDAPMTCFCKSSRNHNIRPLRQNHRNGELPQWPGHASHTPSLHHNPPSIAYKHPTPSKPPPWHPDDASGTRVPPRSEGRMPAPCQSRNVRGRVNSSASRPTTPQCQKPNLLLAQRT